MPFNIGTTDFDLNNGSRDFVVQPFSNLNVIGLDIRIILLKDAQIVMT